MERVRIQKLPVDRVEIGEAVDIVDKAARTHAGCSRIYFLNAHCANVAWKRPEYRAALERADLVFADGSGVAAAARIQRIGKVPNVNGTDLFPLLMDRFGKTGSSVFFLGAKREVVEALAAKVGEKWPAVKIAGFRSGFFSDPAVAAREVRDSRADVLFVGMGVPRQELWIDAWARESGVAAVLAVGGLFDFYSDRMPRAPLWMRSVGIEWVFRLAMEPARMWRRYLLGNIIFLTRSIWMGRSGGRA